MSENFRSFFSNINANSLMFFDSYDMLEAMTGQFSMPQKLKAWYKATEYTATKCYHLLHLQNAAIKFCTEILFLIKTTGSSSIHLQ
jgi:Rad3-related DNA helicase